MSEQPQLTSDDYRRIVQRAAAGVAEASNYRAALELTLAACLPELGDFGFFDARADGDTVIRAARAHDNPELEAILRPTRWTKQERRDINLCALSTGEPALHGDIGDAWYVQVAANDAHLEVMRRLGFRSMITVPMHYRGELIGALTLFMAGSGRRHAREHAEVAADVAALMAPLVGAARLNDRKEGAEAALQMADEKLRLSVRAAALGVWEWRFADNSVYWSPEYREIYGLTPDELPTFQRGLSAVEPEDVPRIQESLGKAVSDRTEFACEHRVRHPIRGLRWLKSIGRVLLDHSGEPMALTGIVLDITDTHRDHEEVRNLRDRLAEELEATRRLHEVSMRTIGRDDRLEDLLSEILRAALHITGRDRGAIQLVDQARDCLKFAAWQGFGPDFIAHFREVCREDPTPSAIAWRRGNRVVIEDVATEPLLAGTLNRDRLLQAGVRGVQSTPLVSRDGRVIGMFTTHSAYPHARDARELRLLDLLSREAADLIERAQAESRLKEADRRKDEFLAILAHELRNPLAPVRFAVGILRAEESTDLQRKQAEAIIGRQVDHMSRLLDDLLDVSRIERGRVELRVAEVEVDSVVSTAVEVVGPAMRAKRHDLRTSIGQKGLVVRADPVRLTQILSNLLSNAAKYTDPGGRVELVVRRDADELVIEVIDTGIGFAPDMRLRLFSLFAQAEGAMQRSEGGLGIGLALVKGFVDLHGGAVEAFSEGPGRGSVFRVRIPGLVAAGIAQGAKTSVTGGSRSLRIVVADDNEDACQACASLLETWGHSVKTATDGVRALELIRRDLPDLAVLDLGMPRMNGLQVATQVRSMRGGNTVALVAMTGWGNPAIRESGQLAGFERHLTKPVDPAVLRELVSAIASRPQTRGKPRETDSAPV